MSIRRLLPALLAGAVLGLAVPGAARGQEDEKKADPIREAEAAVEKARAALKRAEDALAKARTDAARQRKDRERGPFGKGFGGGFGGGFGKGGFGGFKKDGMPFGGKGPPIERLDRIEQMLKEITREIEELRKERGPAFRGKEKDKGKGKGGKGKGPRRGGEDD